MGELTPMTPLEENVMARACVKASIHDDDGQLPKLSIQSLLTGDVSRLRNVTRHSTSLVLHKETVAEHSYYVALYAMMICTWLEDYNVPVDSQSVMLRCLVHDLDEARTGDFQRPFKHRSAALKAAIEHAAKEEFVTTVAPIFSGNEWHKAYFSNLWTSAKDDSTEGRVVAFADYLSVVSYLCGETGSANYSIIQDYQTMTEYSSSFEVIEYDFIRPLVDQASAIVRDIIAKATSGGANGPVRR